MSTQPALMTKDSVSVYLTTLSIPFTSITELTNGTGNWVYLISCPDSKYPPQFIIKHAAPYVKAAPSIPFPVSRQTFDARILSVLPDILSASSPSIATLKVAPVSLLRHDEARHALHLSYGGSRNLKEAYLDPKLDIPGFGSRLGTWLAHLHTTTAKVDIGDNKAAKEIYRYCYRNVAGTLEEYGLNPELGRSIDERWGSMLATEDEVVCHGDFWTGNVVVADGDDQSMPDLTIVDWEMTRRGTPATDFAQFAAEAFLLDFFKGDRSVEGKSRGLRRAFVEAYLEASAPSKEFLQRAAVHFGCHLAFWPARVEWGDRETTLVVINAGARVMEMASNENWDGLSDSELLTCLRH